MAIVRHCYETASGTAYPITVNKPTSSSPGPSPKNAAVGDLLLVVAINDGTEVGPLFDQTGAPTGFGFIGVAGNDTVDTHVGLYSRIVDGSEGSSFTVDALASHDGSVVCYLISGAHATAPILEGGTPTVDNTPPIGIPGVASPVYPNSLAMAVYSYDGGDEGGFSTSGTGWSEVLEHRSGSTQADVSGGISERQLSGSEASGTCTISVGTSDGMAGFQFLIRPSAAGPDQGVTGNTIASGAAINVPTLAYVVATAHQSSSLALYEPSVAPGPVSVTGASISSGVQLFSPSLAGVTLPLLTHPFMTFTRSRPVATRRT